MLREDIEDVSGSAQRGGGADMTIMLTTEREDGRVLASKVVFVKLRDGVDEHPKPVTFSTALPYVDGTPSLSRRAASSATT
jgi:hypothetical protein